MFGSLALLFGCIGEEFTGFVVLGTEVIDVVLEAIARRKRSQIIMTCMNAYNN